MTDRLKERAEPSGVGDDAVLELGDPEPGASSDHPDVKQQCTPRGATRHPALAGDHGDIDLPQLLGPSMFPALGLGQYM